MEYRKNDIVTLKIEDCGIDGEGIGKADGFTVFVKDAVIGDTVRIWQAGGDPYTLTKPCGARMCFCKTVRRLSAAGSFL